MKSSIKKGFGFGLTSGIITTLGLIVGLNSSTGSGEVVMAGILIIAIADAMSDALGMHISEESTGKRSQLEVWESTLATFLAKLFFALSFIVPFLFLPLSGAVTVCIVWAVCLTIGFSYYIAREEKTSPSKVILEHLLITIFVILATHYVGEVVRKILLS